MFAGFHGVIQVTRTLEDFEVAETSTSHLTKLCPNVKVIIQCVVDHSPMSKVKMTTLRSIFVHKMHTHTLHTHTHTHTPHTHYTHTHTQVYSSLTSITIGSIISKWR